MEIFTMINKSFYGLTRNCILMGSLLCYAGVMQGFQSDVLINKANLPNNVCAPKTFPDGGKIGKCVSLDFVDQECPKGEISASHDCTNDFWCCYDAQLAKSRGKPKQTVPVTPPISSCTPTGNDSVGPYYVNGAPVYSMSGQQTVMVCPNGFRDDRVLLSGYLRFRSNTSACGTPRRAMLDIWQGNQTGYYSIVPENAQNPNPAFFQAPAPFTLQTNATSVTDPLWFCRIKIITGDDGYYSISTVIPGRYEILAGWRPAHIHFRIFQLDAYNQPVGPNFVTQIYFNYDMFRPTDTCPICNAMDPTQTVTFDNTGDFKTFVGKLDFLI